MSERETKAKAGSLERHTYATRQFRGSRKGTRAQLADQLGRIVFFVSVAGDAGVSAPIRPLSNAGRGSLRAAHCGKQRAKRPPEVTKQRCGVFTLVYL